MANINNVTDDAKQLPKDEKLIDNGPEVVAKLAEVDSINEGQGVPEAKPISIQQPAQPVQEVTVPAAQNTATITKEIIQQPVIKSVATAPDTAIPVKAKKIKPLLLSLIIVGGIVLLGTGSVLATEMGVKTGLDKYYNSVGLYKMWGGLPYDGKAAMAISAKKMNDVSKMRMNATVSINANISNSLSGTPIDAFLKKGLPFAKGETVGKVLGINSYEAPVTTTPSQSYEQQISANINLTGNMSDEKQDLTLTIESPLLDMGLEYMTGFKNMGNKISVDMKGDADDYYFRVPLLGKIAGTDQTKWVKYDRQDAISYNDVKSEGTSDNDLVKYKDCVDYSKKVASEEINGVATAKYETKLDVRKFIESSQGATAGMYGNEFKNSNIMLYTWIGKKDKYMHKIEFVMNYAYQGANIRFILKSDMSNFNQDFNVSLPGPSEIEPKGFEAIMDAAMENTSGGAYGQMRARARDARRKSNTQALSSAMEIYYDSNDEKYPVSKKWCLMSNLRCGGRKVLAGNYISPASLSSMELNRMSYYSKDGKHYEIRMLLENKEGALTASPRYSGVQLIGGKPYFVVKDAE